MKIQITENLKDLSGKDIIENEKTIPLKEVLANSIVNSKEIAGIDSTLRCHVIGVELFKTGVMELSAGERQAINEFIEKKAGYSILVKHQIQKIIEAAENKS
jgi:hypothetical protein